MKQRFRIRFFCVTSWLFLFPYFLFAQDIHFSHLTTRDGLSSNDVYCAQKDNTGLYWIGTANGLNVYDGHSFRVLHHNPSDKTSIPNDHVRSLLLDEYGFLWIGTDGGLAKMDLKTWRCTSYTNDAMNTSGPGNFKNYFISYKDSIYLFSHNSAWRIKNHQLNFEPVAPCGEKVSLVDFALNDERYAFATHDKIIIQERKDLLCHEIILPDELRNFSTITRLNFSTARKWLWISTWGRGLWQMDLENFLLSPCLADPGNEIVMDIEEIIEGDVLTLYAGTAGGITRFSENEDGGFEARYFSHNDNNVYSVNGGCESAFAISDDETWWVSDRGINIMLSTDQAAQRLTDIPGNLTGYIETEENGQLLRWFTTWDAMGIYVNHDDGAVKNIHPNPRSSDRNWDQVGGMIRAVDGSYWVATFAGIVHTRYEKGEWKVLDSWDGISAISLQQDSAHRIWIATYRDGIWLSDGGRTGPISEFANELFSAGTSPDFSRLCWHVLKRKNGDIVVAMNEGLYIYDINDKVADSFSEVTTQHGGTTLGMIYTTFEDNKGRLWLSTSNGLFEYRSGTNCTHYSTANGLSDNSVLSTCEDLSGTLWVMCETGLCRLSGTTTTIFSADHGLPFYAPYGIIARYSQKGNTPSGTLIIGSERAPIIFNCDLATRDHDVMRPSIHMMEVDSLVIRVAQNALSKDGESQKDETIYRFGHDQNNFQFSFSLPIAFASERVSYSYRLLGGDTDVVSAGHRNVAAYSDLKPGEYVFQVWSDDHPENVASVRFIIDPPFWNTWWFVLLCICASVVIIAYVVRYISTRNLREKILVLEKQQALERERTRISQDMHDELGSSLTKISILSDVAKAQQRKGISTEKSLEEISGASREMVQGLQEIIWTLKSQNDTLTSLAAYIRETTAKFFESSAIELKVDYPDSIPASHLDEEQRRNIYLVIKESLNNAMKHSKATEVVLQMKLEGNRVIFVVRDNGIGIREERKRPFSNGLTGMKERAEKIGAVLSIHESRSGGTSVELSVELVPRAN